MCNFLRLFLRFFLCFTLFFTFANLARATPLNDLLHDPNSPVAGNPNGSVTIVEFFDYQCSHCIRMLPIINQLIASNHNVRVVYKDLPIPIGPLSDYAARAALASKPFGKYIAVHDALLRDMQLSKESILAAASSLHLDLSAWQMGMNSAAVNKIIQNNFALAKQFKVEGTPAFFIGKTNAKTETQIKLVMGEMTFQDVTNLVKQFS